MELRSVGGAIVHPMGPKILAASVLVALLAEASAQTPARPQTRFDEILYKGVVGKALDALPLDPEDRVALQRASAVASGTASGRALSVWVGLTNPVLLVGGFAWGLFAASNIHPEQTQVKETEAAHSETTGPSSSQKTSIPPVERNAVRSPIGATTVLLLP